MTPEQFQQLADEGYNRIPMMHEVLADLETPLSAYLKLADGPYSYLFESVQGGEKWGRYSIIGLPASTILKVRGHDITLEQAAGRAACGAGMGSGPDTGAQLGRLIKHAVFEFGIRTGVHVGYP